MRAIEIGAWKFFLPEHRGELSVDQYARVYDLMMKSASSDVRVQAAVRLLRADLTWWHRRKWNKVWVDGAALVEVGKCLGWIWNDEECAAWVQEFSWEKETWCMPSPWLEDVCVEEYSYLDMFFRQLAAGDEGAAIALAATLLRPKKGALENDQNYNGRPRVAWNPNRIGYFEEKIKQMPDWVIYLCVDYAMRAQKYIRERYKPLFEGSGEDDGVPNLGWLGMILSIAEGGVFGDQATVRMAPINDVCIYATKRTLEARVQERKLREMREKHRKSA